MLSTQILDGLTRLEGRAISNLPGIRWEEEDTLVVDLLRGAMFETGWRGSLSGYSTTVSIEGWFVAARAFGSELLARIGTHSEPNGPGLHHKIGLGTYKWKYNPDILLLAHAVGFRFLDTAESYGYGRVETIIGEHMGKFPQLRELDVATKVARNHLSEESIQRACVRSGKRLGVKKHYLYQAHWPNISNPIHIVIGGLCKLAKERLVTGIGVCNYSMTQLMFARAAANPMPISSIQIRYNLSDRWAEVALLPYCKDAGVSVIAYSPLGQDFSTLLDAPGGRVLKELAQSYSASPAQIALAWVLSKPGVIPIPRTNNLHHLEELYSSQALVILPNDFAQLEIAYPITY